MKKQILVALALVMTGLTVGLAEPYPYADPPTNTFFRDRTGSWKVVTKVDDRIEDTTEVVLFLTPKRWSKVSLVNYWNSDGSLRGYIQNSGVHYAISYYGTLSWWCTNAVQIISLDGQSSTNALPPIWTPSVPIWGDVGRMVWTDGYVEKTYWASISYDAYSYMSDYFAEEWSLLYMDQNGQSVGPQRFQARCFSTVVVVPTTMGRNWVSYVNRIGPYPVQPPTPTKHSIRQAARMNLE